jgi:hypothetical protein
VAFPPPHPEHEAWPALRASAPAGASRASGAPGLVTQRTSDTPVPEIGEEIEIDQKQARYRRMRRSVMTAARLIEFALGPRRFRPAMLTLTYRDVDGFKPRHVSELLQRIRQWLKRKGHGFAYVWVGELQRRGALHYHVLVWLPRGLTLPKPDKQGWWRHGSTRIEWARNAVGYLCKYVSKFDGPDAFPKGARLHGAGGFDLLGKQVRRWFNLPAWLKSAIGVGRRVVRLKGFGLVDGETGVCMPSPWRVSCRGGRVFARRIAPLETPLRPVEGPWSEWPRVLPAAA